MIGRLKNLAPVALAGISLVASAAALADDVKLPPTMAVTAYDTGTAGFNIAVGVGKMMKDKYSTDVRVLPAGNDVARLAPLRAKRALMSAMGSDSARGPEMWSDTASPRPRRAAASAPDAAELHRRQGGRAPAGRPR